MSIDRTQSLKPVSQVQQRESGDVAKTKRKQAEAQSEVSATQVKLSDAQAKLMQPGTQDIDMNRVETLKQAIRDGSLKIDAGKIADALLKETQDFLAGN
ncbi:negative regulator of flagellin synthesis [Pectobacterium atrosepticum SCRI1043]|jgi:negative regulator of flagellin synthesis FlgM|uniref:Negative regulator of flagellin synthesis n=4 Tax=Pectobacterium TaxID=122277 RepID=Q6D6I1_PECAS|nr:MULTISPECIES: flagellar biosynthesis anti-sigma factor FlgM [Pectobacterium]MCL6408635.1 anti-sigma-28 factor FlgM [Dickeya dadantii]AIA70549.1 flagellar biosynthesis anti-sigma factor FlgM [Pectobacterium atrosepticum]AIK14685.1 negative regulator of flagellin synthesis [Pectobacterium atrosepticum]AIU88938.1 flagellar biosynthesis anti-sigma factor FlgM [Pectobacterium odoriferum]ASN86239.1 Negative regulator of flagellin synthesis FlgM [Pectobacterium versatile]